MKCCSYRLRRLGEFGRSAGSAFHRHLNSPPARWSAQRSKNASEINLFSLTLFSQIYSDFNGQNDWFSMCQSLCSATGWWVSVRDIMAPLTNYLDRNFHKMNHLKKAEKRREKRGERQLLSFLQTHLCSKCLVDNLHCVWKQKTDFTDMFSSWFLCVILNSLYIFCTVCTCLALLYILACLVINLPCF